MITIPNLDAKSREQWTQKHTNTALALNQILGDRQNRNWEERLKEIEEAGRTPRETLPPSKTVVRNKPKPRKAAEMREPRPGTQETERSQP